VVAITTKDAMDTKGWPFALVRGLLDDFRFALRLTRKDPWFTIVAAATLALGIGFDTTLFTIANGMDASRALTDGNRVVSINSLDPAGRSVSVSYPDFRDWQTAATGFSSLGAVIGAAMILTDRDIAPERLSGAYVSANTFSLIDRRPILGRDFTADDDRPGAARVAIVGASVWKGRYGADPRIVGRTITINGVAATVVGVMPDGFRFPLVHDLWQPLDSNPQIAGQRRDRRTLDVFGRLAPGVSIERASQELSAIAAALSRAYPATNDGVRAQVEPYGGRFTITNPWNAMLGAVTFVLLIACANVANLLLARGAARAAEIAIRSSLGAPRWRIVRQLLVESLLLASMAGAAGVAVAAAGVRLWLAAMPVANWPYWYHFEIDRGALVYLAAISAGSAVLFGLAPALQLSRSTPAESLHASARARGARTHRWTSTLLAAQLALTLSLLAGAALLARTLGAVYRADAIVDASPIVIAGVDLPPQRYATPEQRVAFYERLEERLGKIPGVESVAMASGAPFFTVPVWPAALEGQADGGPASPSASVVFIGSRYFDVLGLRPLQGRAFTDVDGTPGHESAVVNQLFASRYFPGRNPIGARIRLSDPGAPRGLVPWLEIVGVTPTVRQHYAEEIDAVVYMPYRVNPRAGMTVMARAASSAAALAPSMRGALRQLDPDLPLVDVRPLEWLLSGSRFANKVFATMFGLAALLGLLLAALGLHAMTQHAIRRRTQEIGIRMALGAERRQVVWLFVRRTLTPLALGVAAGLAGALGVGRFVSGMLIQTSPSDPLTLAGITLVLIVVALAAAIRPARGAARIDPAAALRAE
jgi:predicted permease